MRRGAEEGGDGPTGSNHMQQGTTGSVHARARARALRSAASAKPSLVRRACGARDAGVSSTSTSPSRGDGDEGHFMTMIVSR